MKINNQESGLTMEVTKKPGYLFTFTSAFGLWPLLLLVLAAPSLASVTEEVQKNIDTLIQTKSCTGCNLTGADLTRLDLSSANLEGADLTSVRFHLADLSEANMSGAVLRGAQFGGADLSGADLRNADLRGAILTGAYTAGSLMDGSLVDRQEIDGDTTSTIYEKVLIPDEKKSKEVPDNKEVKISTVDGDKSDVTRALSSDVPTTDEGGPGADLLEEAPPVKTISPPGRITIIASAEALGEVEPDTNGKPGNERVEQPGASTEPQPYEIAELLAEPETKSKVNPEYRELTQEKKSLPRSTDQESGTGKQLVAEADNPDATPAELGPAMVPGQGTATVIDTPVSPGAEKDNAPEESPEILPEMGETVKGQDAPAVIGTGQVGPKDQGEPEKAYVGASPDIFDEPEKKVAKQEVSEIIEKQVGAGNEAGSSVPDGVQVIEPAGPVIVEKDIPAGPEKQADAQTVGEAGQGPLEPEAMEGQPGPGEQAALLEKLLDENKCYGCDFSGVDLSDKNLDEADLERSNFSNALLEGIDLSEANLKGVSFLNANLKNADLRKADLYKANFSGADLTGADLKGALLDDAIFTDAIGLDVNMMAN
jgi:uncharacterized protein YjbI with pentapeptide repeats